MFDFCIENYKFNLVNFWVTDTELPKDKSIVSTFSVFLVNKYAVITNQKNSYVECFSFRQQKFVFADIFPDISIKLTKLYFQSKRKNLSNDFALFP